MSHDQSQNKKIDQFPLPEMRVANLCKSAFDRNQKYQSITEPEHYRARA